MSSIVGLVSCRPILDSGDVEILVSGVGAWPIKGAEPCKERIDGVLL